MPTLYVAKNSERPTSTLREVVLVPNRMWGGEGLLGCGVGFGLLHRIPKPSSEQQYDAFQDNYTSPQRDVDQPYEDEAELFVPADHLLPDDDEFPDRYPLNPIDETEPPSHAVPTMSGSSSQKTNESDEGTPTPASAQKQPLSVFTAADEPADNEVPTPTPSSPVSPQLEAQSLSYTPLSLSASVRNEHPVSDPRGTVRSPTLASGSPMLRQFSNPTFRASRFGPIQNRIPSPIPRSSIPRMAQDVDSDEEDEETTSTKRTSNGSVTSVDD